MKQEVFVAILSSSIISAFITTMAGYIINKRQITIDNITQERKFWREDIRKISEEINSASNISDLLFALSKLKIRINPYGINSSKNYLSDGYIWFIINKIENSNLDETCASFFKQYVTAAIASMLKYDWDRSKAEIQGNMKMRLVFTSYIIGFILNYLYALYVNPKCFVTVFIEQKGIAENLSYISPFFDISISILLNMLMFYAFFNVLNRIVNRLTPPTPSGFLFLFLFSVFLILYWIEEYNEIKSCVHHLDNRLNGLFCLGPMFIGYAAILAQSFDLIKSSRQFYKTVDTILLSFKLNTPKSELITAKIKKQ